MNKKEKKQFEKLAKQLEKSNKRNKILQQVIDNMQEQRERIVFGNTIMLQKDVKGLKEGQLVRFLGGAGLEVVGTGEVIQIDNDVLKAISTRLRPLGSEDGTLCQEYKKSQREAGYLKPGVRKATAVVGHSMEIDLKTRLVYEKPFQDAEQITLGNIYNVYSYSGSAVCILDDNGEEYHLANNIIVDNFIKVAERGETSDGLKLGGIVGNATFGPWPRQVTIEAMRGTPTKSFAQHVQDLANPNGKFNEVIKSVQEIEEKQKEAAKKVQTKDEGYFNSLPRWAYTGQTTSAFVHGETYVQIGWEDNRAMLIDAEGTLGLVDVNDDDDFTPKGRPVKTAPGSEWMYIGKTNLDFKNGKTYINVCTEEREDEIVVVDDLGERHILNGLFLEHEFTELQKEPKEDIPKTSVWRCIKGKSECFTEGQEYVIEEDEEGRFHTMNDSGGPHGMNQTFLELYFQKVQEEDLVIGGEEPKEVDQPRKLRYLDKDTNYFTYGKVYTCLKPIKANATVVIDDEGGQHGLRGDYLLENFEIVKEEDSETTQADAQAHEEEQNIDMFGNVLVVGHGIDVKISDEYTVQGEITSFNNKGGLFYKDDLSGHEKYSSLEHVSRQLDHFTPEPGDTILIIEGDGDFPIELIPGQFHNVVGVEGKEVLITLNNGYGIHVPKQYYELKVVANSSYDKFAVGDEVEVTTELTGHKGEKTKIDSIQPLMRNRYRVKIGDYYYYFHVSDIKLIEKAEQ